MLTTMTIVALSAEKTPPLVMYGILPAALITVAVCGRAYGIYRSDRHNAMTVGVAAAVSEDA